MIVYKAQVLLVLTLLAASLPSLVGAGNHVDSGTPPVSFVLRAVRNRVVPGGEAAEVRIEIRNNGNADFIVGKNFLPITNSSTYVLLEIKDSHGHSEPAVNMTVGAPFPSQSVSWTRIAPGHYYGVDLTLDSRDYPGLSHPGRYEVTATYVSKGGNTPASPEWQVPSSPVWKGKIVSNSIWIQILPASKSSKIVRRP